MYNDNALDVIVFAWHHGKCTLVEACIYLIEVRGFLGISIAGN